VDQPKVELNRSRIFHNYGDNMLSQQQITSFITKAKSQGFSDAEIKAEIARKQQETMAATPNTPPVQPIVPSQQQPVGQMPVTQPVTQPTQQAPVTVQVNTPGAGQPQAPTTSPQAPQGGFVSNFFKAVLAPAKRYGQFVGEGIGQGVRELTSGSERDALNAKVQAGGVLTPEEQKRLEQLTSPIFMDDKGFDRISTPGGIATEGAKSAIGAASYVVPGGAGGKLGLTGIKALVASGAIQGGVSSALASIGTSEDEDIDKLVERVGWDTVSGGLLGGAFSLAGPALKGSAKTIGKTLQGAGEDLQIGTYVKKMGAKPVQKFGGNKLLQDMKNLKFKAGDADSVIQQADEILDTNGDIIGSVAEEMSKKKKTVDISPIIKGLKAKIKATTFEGDKAKVQKVLDEITGATKGGTKLDPIEFYKLKQAMGGKGRWSSMADPDTVFQAETWRDAYIQANDLFDDALQQHGFNDFRSVNKALHTAMNAKAWAENVANKAPNVNAFGLMDTLATIGGATAGGLPGAAAGFFLKKAVNSAVAREATGMGAKGAGKAFEKASNLKAAVPDAVKNAAVIGATGMDTVDKGVSQAQAATDIGTPDVPSPTGAPTAPSPADPFGGMTKQQILFEASAQGATTADLEEIAKRYDLLSGAGSQGKLTEQQQATSDTSFLVDKALNDLETKKIKTGFVEAPLENLKAKFGAADQDTLDFNVSLGSLKATLAKARAGTSFTPNEEALLNTYTPTAGDSAQELKTKLTGLKQLLDYKLKGNYTK
jgi:hypothetical protein